MRNTAKVRNLERLFPLLAVENGCIISKEADLTVAFKVELPELFTITEEEYEQIHSTWSKAIKVLPVYSIVHKQDWYTTETYRAEHLGDAQMSFLDRSSERHFNERPFLNHDCYLYLTKTTRQRMAQKSDFSSLVQGRLVPKEMTDKEGVNAFLDAVDQFERIVNDSGLFHIVRLTEEELLGKDNERGLLDRYLSLERNKSASLEDLSLRAKEVRIGDKMLCLHTLSSTEDLPTSVSTDRAYEKLSTDKSSCRLSFSSPVGLLLSCNHIYNQYLFIPDGEEAKKRFESTARNMHSLARYSRANAINEEWIHEYLNTSVTLGISPIRAHFNVLAWSDNEREMTDIKNMVGSAISSMDCTPRHNTVDTATLYWAGMPGNAGDFPSEESYWTFVPPALCLFSDETNYKDSLSPFGIKMCDRLSGKPIHVDISDLPMKKGITTNRNKFILGPSGSGKSFFCNHMVRQYYEQGTHILLIDTGNSYEGLCQFIHTKTKGEDGIYYTYTEETPIAFNPFYTDDYVFDIEKKESLATLILTLWKSGDEKVTKTEVSELFASIGAYINKITEDRSIVPSFNTYYEFMLDEYRQDLLSREIKVTREDFNIDNLLTTLKHYYRGGEYDYLLNSTDNIDLLSKRFVVFEIDAIKDNKILFPVVTIIIMESFINKMRRLKDERKMIVIEEAWKAISSANMAEFIKYLYKTVRKHFGEAVVVTQDPDDILRSPIVRESIINNSDCKILLDQRKYMNKFDAIQDALGLTNKEKEQILSINQNNDPNRLYKEVWFGLGGMVSAVYATEVSLEEYYAYTTEATEKVAVQRLADQLGGDIELAIRQMAQKQREKNEL
ncbi:TraG family conjugative transposon ATPase [Porphyromonas sp.]|uniref:TraG family conjugative transposon ATPase n=1 Tax=Porphyromonas sp. TaxID=1924944 RepID=UPI003AB50BC5